MSGFKKDNGSSTEDSSEAGFDLGIPLTGELRPVRTAFLFQRLAPVAFGILAVFTTAVVATEWLAPEAVTTWQVALLGVVVLALWFVIAGVWTHTAYAKERYEFLDHRIVAHRGSPISDQTTELAIRNITHVKRRLPWLRYPLFGVGDVMIESAGSDASEIILRTIRRPDQVYEGVAALMRDNGFNLARDELLHEEQPNRLAVAIECTGMTLATIVATFIALGEMYFGDEGGGQIGLYLSLLPLLGIVAIIFHYLDMRRRTYRVYSGIVMYEEGFLTRDDAFIPGENIADSSTRRGLLDLILGLYDVRISCQGSQGEIQFRRLRRGPELSSTVERVVTHVGRHATVAASATFEEDGRPPVAVARNRSEDQATGTDASTTSDRSAQAFAAASEKPWIAELRPSPIRTAAPYLVLCVVAFPLVPVWIVGILRAMINAYCTRYSVRHNSVRERFQFLHSTERDFSYDKVTGLVIRENPLDRFFGTLTISIWSIGSAQPLELSCVERHRVKLDALLRQLGIPEPAVVDEIPSRFSLRRMILATLPVQLTCSLAVVIILLLGLALNPWYFLLFLPFIVIAAAIILHRFLYYPRCSVTVHQNHLECAEGWLWRQHFYARHDNIKRIELTRYPGGDIGTVHFVAAGEYRPGNSAYATRKKSQKESPAFGRSSYGFQVRYAEQMSRHAWALDERLRGQEPDIRSQDDSVEHASGAALVNYLVGLCFFSVLIVPLIVLLPITVPWTLFAVRRRRYLIEPHRVLLRRGILYQRQASILHDRIDSIRRHQHLFGKLFGNGNVTIFTAGSSRPDLELTNAPDFRQLYELLHRHYED